jgi:hypothetical protein
VFTLLAPSSAASHPLKRHWAVSKGQPPRAVPRPYTPSAHAQNRPLPQAASPNTFLSMFLLSFHFEPPKHNKQSPSGTVFNMFYIYKGHPVIPK